MADRLLFAYGLTENRTRVEVRAGDDGRLRLHTAAGGSVVTPLGALGLIEVLRDFVLLRGDDWHRADLNHICRPAR